MTSTSNYPAVTTTELGHVILGAQHFTVQEIHFSTYVDSFSGDTRPATSELHLTGVRGATYFLRGFLNRHDGVFQVISWKSGQPLRVKGNEVRVVRIGDQLEVHVPTARG